LRSALRTAHEEIAREFDGHVSVGISVIAVERDDVYLAQVAPAQVYVLHDGSLHSIAAATEGTAPFGRALGASASPQISLFRDQVAAGDVVALCTSWFHRVADPEELRECFGAGSADDIAESLLDLAKQHDARDVTAIVVEGVSAREAAASTEDEAPGFLEQVDTAVQALAGVGRMLWSELRVPETTKNGATAETREREPAHAETGTAAAEPAGEVYERESPEVARPAVEPEDWQSEITTEHPVVGDEPEQRTDEVPIVTEERPIEAQPEPEPAVPEPEPEIPAAPTPREPLSEMEQVNSRIQSDPALGDAMPPVQAFPDTSTEPSRIYATSRDMQAVNRRPRRFGGISRPSSHDPLVGPAVIRPGLGDIDLRHPVARPAPPAVVWGAMAVVFLLAVGALALYYRHHHTTFVNPYPARAAADIRHAAAATVPTTQEADLAKAQRDITLARRDGASPATIRKLNRRLLATSDTLHHITRVTGPSLLSDFAKFPNARPGQIAAAPGLIFVLDSGRKGVFSVATNFSTSNPTEIVQQGESYSGFTVGMPQLITTDGSTALVLDDHTTLIRDAGGVKTATALAQQTQAPETIVAIAVSDPDVYLLDTTSSQVWRYPQAVVAFNPTGAAYFTPTTPNLAHAIGLAFDRTDMYVLQKGGAILKFDFQANPQKFTVTLPSYITPVQDPVGLYTDANQKFIWIADRAQGGRILQLDKSGGYIHSYVSGTAGMDLSQLKSFTVGPAGNTLYVLAGSRLYDFAVAQ
jgi:hypothetical protein